MDYNKHDMKFIVTTDSETADKLKYAGFSVINVVEDKFIFLNDGKKLTFDVEKYNAVYTNILCL